MAARSSTYCFRCRPSIDAYGSAAEIGTINQTRPARAANIRLMRTFLSRAHDSMYICAWHNHFVRRGTMARRFGIGGLLAMLLSVSPGISGQPASSRLPSTASGDWPHYTADMRGTKYSPLAQIDASNFSKLEVAWRFKTDNLGPYPEWKLEGTPVMVKGVLYTTGGTRVSAIVLDAKTDEWSWTHCFRQAKRARVSH